jgi:hypothetical protein
MHIKSRWRVRIAFVALLVFGLEAGSRVLLHFFSRRFSIQVMSLSPTQKIALEVFANRNQACFTPEDFQSFMKSHPEASVLDELKVHRAGLICIPWSSVTAAARTKLGAALRELEMRCGSSRFDPDLGWDTLPSSKQYVPFPVVATYNEAGIRSHRSYSVEKPPGIRRIAALGDSYTHGHGVSDADAWTTRLATTTGAEVLNFGVGYYGLGQSFLKYQLKARAYHSDVVLICYYDRDLMRDVNRFRYWFNPNNQTFIPTAPRYRLDRDRLVLVPNPCRTADDYSRLLREDPALLEEARNHDVLSARFLAPSAFDCSAALQILRCAVHAIRRPREPRYYVDGVYDPSSEAFQVTAAILRDFCVQVAKDGAKPVVVILPSEESFLLFQSAGKRAYQPLLEALSREGRSCIDLLDDFAARKREEVFTGHYSVLGNQIVADALGRQLAALGLLTELH